jgi:dTDP-4-dehydrorhamnose reductase
MRPILITGGPGTLARAFARLCAERYLSYEITSRAELDIADPDAVAAVLARLEPWLVVNAAGYARIDQAEHEAERCHRDNVVGAETVARACARDRVRLVTLSADLVFDGEKGAPYDEADAPAPLGVYGRSKRDAEARVLAAHPEALVVRTGACFGPWDAHNFVTLALGQLATGHAIYASDDTFVSPTYVPDLVHACLDLAIDGERGLWHVANAGTATWAALATEAATVAGQPTERVVAVPAALLAGRAPRPRFSALHSNRGQLLPPWNDALRRYHEARLEEIRR